MPLRTIPVAAEMLGLVAAGTPDALMIWTEENGRRVLSDRQEQDPETNEPLWTCYLMPTTSERPEIIQVRTASRQQPVLGLFSAVAVDNLAVNVRVGRDGKLAQYWSASAVRDAGQSGRKNGHQEHKEGQPA